MRLLLDKITFIDNIVICFNCVDKIVYRERTCYFVDACVCKSKNKSTIAIILYFFSKCFLLCVLSVKIFLFLAILIVPVSNKVMVTVAR